MLSKTLILWKTDSKMKQKYLLFPIIVALLILLFLILLFELTGLNAYFNGDTYLSKGDIIAIYIPLAVLFITNLYKSKLKDQTSLIDKWTTYRNCIINNLQICTDLNSLINVTSSITPENIDKNKEVLYRKRGELIIGMVKYDTIPSIKTDNCDLEQMHIKYKEIWQANHVNLINLIDILAEMLEHQRRVNNFYKDIKMNVELSRNTESIILEIEKNGYRGEELDIERKNYDQIKKKNEEISNLINMSMNEVTRLGTLLKKLSKKIDANLTGLKNVSIEFLSEIDTQIANN